MINPSNSGEKSVCHAVNIGRTTTIRSLKGKQKPFCCVIFLPLCLFEVTMRKPVCIIYDTRLDLGLWLLTLESGAACCLHGGHCGFHFLHLEEQQQPKHCGLFFFLNIKQVASNHVPHSRNAVTMSWLTRRHGLVSNRIFFLFSFVCTWMILSACVPGYHAHAMPTEHRRRCQMPGTRVPVRVLGINPEESSQHSNLLSISLPPR